MACCLVQLSNLVSLWQVADYLVGLVSSSPEVLGDPQRESVEELQERYERTVASALATLATLITLSSEGDLDFVPSFLRPLHGTLSQG